MEHYKSQCSQERLQWSRAAGYTYPSANVTGSGCAEGFSVFLGLTVLWMIFRQLHISIYHSLSPYKLPIPGCSTVPANSPELSTDRLTVHWAYTTLVAVHMEHCKTPTSTPENTEQQWLPPSSPSTHSPFGTKPLPFNTSPVLLPFSEVVQHIDITTCVPSSSRAYASTCTSLFSC